MCATHSQKPNESQPRVGMSNSEKCSTPSIETNLNNSIVHCIYSLLFTISAVAHIAYDKNKERTFTASSNFHKCKHAAKKVKSCFYSDIRMCESLKEALTRASVRREVRQYHFLCLSACETAANTFATPSLIFTEPPRSSADGTQMMAFSCELKGRRQRSLALCLTSSKNLFKVPQLC